MRKSAKTMAQNSNSPRINDFPNIVTKESIATHTRIGFGPHSSPGRFIAVQSLYIILHLQYFQAMVLVDVVQDRHRRLLAI